MKKFLFLLSGIVWSFMPMQAQNEITRYIDVTGSAEMEVIPDEIHFLIEIKEYFKEEFDGKSKPENYKTKVPLSQIEAGVRTALQKAGVPAESVRTQEVGDYWRERGKDFLISKRLDITLQSFEPINVIIKNLDTKGINSMRIGELKNKDLPRYRDECKVEALKAAKAKAALFAEAVGMKLGDVIWIVEPGSDTGRSYVVTANKMLYASALADGIAEESALEAFRLIELSATMSARFELVAP